MRWTYVADVGDGLCMTIRTTFGATIQIDCGSQNGSVVAFDVLRRIHNGFFDPDVFCLSHFHADHYNGLLYASINTNRIDRFNIEEVYYPRIPEFAYREEFLKAIFAMNMRVFGEETGVMAYDFLDAISKINRMNFHYKAVSKDDVIDVNSSLFHVLWPPKVLQDNRTIAPVRKALRDFYKALDIDEEMKQLYNRVAEEGTFKAYIEDEGIKEPKERSIEQQIRSTKREGLPAVVKKANKSLRCAANHLSLALSEDNRLLFLGDTNGHELRQIVDSLDRYKTKRFHVLITPHHGTHWNQRLKEIGCTYSVSSTGKKWVSKINPGYKDISRITLATYVNGDILVPRSTDVWREPLMLFHRGIW